MTAGCRSYETATTVDTSIYNKSRNLVPSPHAIQRSAIHTAINGPQSPKLSRWILHMCRKNNAHSGPLCASPATPERGEVVHRDPPPLLYRAITDKNKMLYRIGGTPQSLERQGLQRSFTLNAFTPQRFYPPRVLRVLRLQPSKMEGSQRLTVLSRFFP